MPPLNTPLRTAILDWRTRIGSGSQNLKGLRFGSNPDLFLLDPDRFRVCEYEDPATFGRYTKHQ